MRNDFGTVVQEELAKIGMNIDTSCDTCKNSWVAALNAWGTDLATSNIPSLLDVLRMEANRNSLPFDENVGREFIQHCFTVARR